MQNAPEFTTHPPDTSREDQDLARLARALGHPHRVAIIRFLLSSPGCIVGDIVEQLPVAPSTVSQHLRKLKESGWIRGEIDGPKICYCIEPKAVERFSTMLQILTEPCC
ncbi:MAG: winged helix-turn-helix transcriptional regulator [Calditrichaeota bacterium]|nr:winged helix-turn-helix transcriptional regulator [Calditrichota bacterium]